MEKIKAFFQNKITKIVAWIVLALDIVVLFWETLQNQRLLTA